MTATHKILVYKDTGKLLPHDRAQPMDIPRPAPPDAAWVPIEEGTALWNHFCEDPPIDISHIDLRNISWDFTNNVWVEVYNPPPVNLAKHKITRNNWLKHSDKLIVEADPADKAAWMTHRQQLRTMFEDLHSTIEDTAKFTGYISGNILTVTAVSEGKLKRAMHIEGTGVVADSHILLHSAHNPNLTGSGDTGTYHIEPSQTLGSADAPISLEGFDYATIIFPRTPTDIQALKDKAAAGDAEAQAIIKRDGL